jgi:hypothetical protein
MAALNRHVSGEGMLTVVIFLVFVVLFAGLDGWLSQQ